MALCIRHQWSLRRIEDSLRRSDPGFADLITTLGKLVLDGNVTDHERLRQRAARGCQLVIAAGVHAAYLAARAVGRCWSAAAWRATRMGSLLAGRGKRDRTAPADHAI